MIKAVIFDMYETLITQYECPQYFAAQMALDAGVDEARFQQLWRPTEDDRSIGTYSLEEILENVLRKCDCFSKSKLREIVAKRMRSKEQAFEHLHSEIIPMLTKIKEKGLQIGLISNCFSEESAVIKKSILYPFFDVACLSYDEGVKKPEEEIYRRCLERLQVQPEECIYVGDGGSNELEAAKALGMKAMQATWYLKEGTSQPCKRKGTFEHLETPLDILKYL